MTQPVTYVQAMYKVKKAVDAPSWMAVAKLQRDMHFSLSRATRVLKKYPVWSITENGAEVDNVGLQFLTIPAGQAAH